MRKRSKYRPKRLIVDTMAWLRAGMTRVEHCSAGMTLKIRNYDAMNNLRKGIAVNKDVDAIIDAMNVADALARRGVGEEWGVDIRNAQDQLFKLACRGVTNGHKFIVRGEELKALNHAMQIHDAQLDAVTISELEQAMADVMEHHRLKRLRKITANTETTI